MEWVFKTIKSFILGLYNYRREDTIVNLLRFWFDHASMFGLAFVLLVVLIILHSLANKLEGK